MIVKMRNPNREVEIDRSMAVGDLLTALDLNREAHLVIVDGELVPRDMVLARDSVVEIRPVISGGSL